MCDIISPQVYETLKHAVKGDVENFEIILQGQNKKGDGYMGTMLFLTLRDKQTGKELHFIVKQAFTDQQLRDSLPVRDAFMNEIFFYTKIFPVLNRFQEKISPECQFQKVPKCFASVSEDNCENLILENLKEQNFELHEKNVPLDKDHFELILKEFGKLHGLSFAYKTLHPEEYERLTSGLIDLFSDLTERGFFQKSVDYVYEICLKSLQPGRDDDLIKKFKPYVQHSKELLADSVINRTKYTVITHGDCWSNNMMFKYNELRKVIDVRFLDFQVIRNASPCFDLSYCIYSGASREILENLDHYLQVYHSSLSSTIRQFGCDPGKLYPMEQLRKDFKLHCNLGLTMALLVWKVKLTYEEGLMDFMDVEGEEKEKMLQSPYDEEAYSKAIRDLLVHFNENDFFTSV